MKFVIFFIVVLCVLGCYAQNGQKNKGEECTKDEECISDNRNMKCVQNYCGCKKGQRQESESRPDGFDTYVCTSVIDLGCTRHEDCNIDLENSECNLSSRRCECNEQKGCKSGKNKGEECQTDDECIVDSRNMKCANNHCGCKKGQRQQILSEGGVSCQKVVGLGCDLDHDCSVDLENAKCNQQSEVCECKKEDGCTDSAPRMAIMSFLPMVFLSLCLLKY